MRVLNPAFDFVSVRGGMQNFNSDFRGYLFVDNELGARVFGTARRNRDQYNVAYFSMRTRDPVTQLHDIQSSTGQRVFIANYFVQDFGTPGYTALFSVHVNHDPRPQARGDGLLDVTYAGFHGDGRWGSWAVSHALYQAFGNDTTAAATTSINARMAAIEMSHDGDWRRWRASLFYSSGSASGTSGGGFDMIADNPNLAGGQFMYWTQQQIKIPVETPTGPVAVLLKDKFSLIPSLRNKFTDRSNFANPGLILVNGGADFRVSPSLKLVTNVWYLRFADVSGLSAKLAALAPGALPPSFSDAQIGIDAGTGMKYRPFVNENLFILAGAAGLLPRGGFANALGPNHPSLFSVFATIQIAY